MIERVAKAIYCQCRQSASGQLTPLGQFYEMPSWEDTPDALREQAREEARAAIEAMREPTEEMINSRMARCYNTGAFRDKEVRRIYTAMINAALSTTEGGNT